MNEGVSCSEAECSWRTGSRDQKISERNEDVAFAIAQRLMLTAACQYEMSKRAGKATPTQSAQRKRQTISR